MSWGYDEEAGTAPRLFWVIIKRGDPLAVFPYDEWRQASDFAARRDAQRMLCGVLGEFSTPLTYAKGLDRE